MHNGYYDRNEKQGVTLQVIISAKHACNGTISNPLANWSQDFSVEANDVTTLTIQESLCYHDGYNYETVSSKGIHIVATDTISVYCVNIADYSFDASFVLPTDGLGNDYIIQTGHQSYLNTPGLNDYKVQNQTSAFLIVATEDNTVVNITPTVATLSGRPAGVTFSVTLPHAGQTYHVRSLREGTERDLSGTRVTAEDCKKIAVFNGNTLTRVPVDLSGTSGFDHVFEQAMPIRSWGKEFVVTSSLARTRDFVNITSVADDNEIYLNNSHLTTLNANQSYLLSLDNAQQPHHIKASKNAAVYLYNTSASDDYTNGDPSMVWIAPVEQKTDEVTFSTFSGNSSLTQIDNHYVNIVISTEDVDNVYLDGTRIPSSDFSIVPAKPEYSYTRKPIPHGSHHLSCANGFNAHVYGFGDARGYAYLVGSNAIDLSTNLIINDISIHEGNVFQYCIEEPVTFFAEVNYQNYNLIWDFGDGQTSTDNPAYHTYHEKDLYSASLIVISDETGCVANDTTSFYVDLTQHYVTKNDEICSGEFYSGYGFSNVLIVNDTVLGSLVDNPANPHCPDSLLIYITAWPTVHVPITDSRCWMGEPGIYEGYGFGFEYDHPDTYYRELELQSSEGCDSIIMLTLYVSEYQLPNPPIDVVRECYDIGETPYYIWERNGEEFHEDTDKEIILPDPDGGCDFKYTLDLKFHPNFVREEEMEHVCDQYTWWATGETVIGEGEHNLFKNFKGGGGPLFDCDSIYTKTVVISNQEVLDTLTFTGCDSVSFSWFGQNYTFYADTVCTLQGKTDDSCQREQPIIVEGMRYSPAPKIACANDYVTVFGDTVAVITNTEFFSFQYDFYVEDTLGHINDWESFVWHITKPSWRFEPYVKEDDSTRYYCRVYVAEPCDDLVDLQCIVYSPCLQECITSAIHLKSSFFGLEDQQKPQPDFSIIPNPNNGEMELRFEHLIGKVNVKVYDMQGSLVDQFETHNTAEMSTLHYTAKKCSRGIYYFVATAMEGTVTRKAVINR